MNGPDVYPRLGPILDALARVAAPSLRNFASTLLDGLVCATRAERGFVVLHDPASTQTSLLAARNFATTSLSVEEYGPSRTVLAEVLRNRRSLLLVDAIGDRRFTAATSVQQRELRSILCVPIRLADEDARGAIYLEDNSRPQAFDESDLVLTEAAARVALLELGRARLLSRDGAEDAVVMDASRASHEIVGRSPRTLEVLALVARIADSPATVLIEGESGTGKELIARALHFQSERKAGPFVAVNCAAIPEGLLESELFGHERGAFTSAERRYLGRVEQAKGGTLFLDEVSELPYSSQAKLLRFLQSGELTRLGGSEVIRVNTRVVAATSKPLDRLGEEGKFQMPLYYRLNVIPVRVAPLRERSEDIALLVEHFAARFAARYRRVIKVDPEVAETLAACPFPGNIRELENLVHRMVALAVDDTLRLGDVPPEVRRLAAPRLDVRKDPARKLLEAPLRDFDDLERRREELARLLSERETELVQRLIKAADGNLTEAARRAGLHRATFHKILKRGEPAPGA